jgi:hypothetical protein
MNQNKTLSAAIFAALTIGGGMAQAGTFTITQPVVTTTPSVAMELFALNTPSAMPSTTGFETTYTLDFGKDANDDPNTVQKAFYISYELTRGVWDWDSDEPSSASIELVRADTTMVKPTISFVGVSGNTAQYLVLADVGDKSVYSGDKILFKGFKVNGTELADPDQNVQLNIKLEDTAGGEIDTTSTLTLIESGVGTTVSFSTGDEDSMIDVAQSGKKFTDNATAANLGTITIAYPGTKMKDYDLITDWDFTGANGVTGGSLTITNGPFAASTKDLIFLELDGNDCVKSGTDIAATSVSGTTASWTLTAAQLKDNLFGNTANICINVDGKTAINETDDAPLAKLVLNYVHHTGIPYQDTLRHIKKNGTICTLYNIPDVQTVAYDKINIRIINRSTASGKLTASLRDDANNAVFTDVPLNNSQAINPNQTVTLDSAGLETLAKQKGHSGEWGRGVLTISSDLIKMEVFGLLRNTNPSGNAPLLNMSIGASGNGCD